ncbi:hypothetical protein [Streptomyces sp. MST-110588]|uniref:hypothetical protein n=1 Tax=Streptomyces sp. MST-110588 TaxID=2833628 RepID=UPI001F5C8C25|nr:hypothetical protein [Streptomyces sp. MST-110588]UNO42008.1 hypothetical protein KGS77_23885 [Streptomyces sp. MST-110588]
MPCSYRCAAPRSDVDGEVDVPVRAAKGVYPSRVDKAQTALSGVGQFDDRATPLQMAMAPRSSPTTVS